MQNFDKMDHMHFIRKLPIPQELKKEMPLTPELAAYKDKRDQEIAAIIRSESDKLLLVIGPCSADREDAVIDYNKDRFGGQLTFRAPNSKVPKVGADASVE